MKILLTHRFFWPDTAPYAHMLRLIGEALAEVGHDVDVFSTLPSYRDGATAPRHEMLGKLRVNRIRVFKREKRNPLKRIANVAIYSAALFAEIIRHRRDVVTASTFPPVFAAWSASLAAKLTGASFIYHVQDIHPEVSFYAGQRLGRGIPGRILKWLDNQTLRRSSCVVTLSNDMAATLRERGLPDLHIHIINNPSLDGRAQHASPPAEFVKQAGKRRVIFAGNIGRFQNLPLLTEGIALCLDRHPDLELMFLGEGTVMADLKLRWGEHPQVRFAPFLPFSQARELIADADVGLVSLSRNINRVAYPSKIATYRDLGLKILALVDPESQIARDLQGSGVGMVPEHETPESIAEALDALLSNRQSSSVQGIHSEPIIPAWTALIDGLVQSR